MIITALLNVLVSLFDTLLVFQIPSLPSEAISNISNVFSYIEAGAGILVNYTPLAYLIVLFLVILAADTAVTTYHIVMWVLKKVPLLNIK